jgi:hypothetical protein
LRFEIVSFFNLAHCLVETGSETVHPQIFHARYIFYFPTSYETWKTYLITSLPEWIPCGTPLF